ncbi:MAG: CHAT domain-containing protein [Vicinamibacterales bacterium]
MRPVQVALAVLTLAAGQPGSGFADASTDVEQATAAAGAPGAGARLLALARARRLLESGAPQEAEPLLTALVAHAEAAGDQQTASLAEGALGRARSMVGDADGAARWFAAAERRARAHDQPRALAWVHLLRGTDAFARGDRDSARAAWEAARDAFAAIADLENQAYVVRALAAVSGAERAEPLLLSAIDLARRGGAPGTEGLALHSLADLAYARGQWNRALALATEALPLVERHGTPIEIVRVHLSLARLHRSHGVRADALAAYERARTRLASIPRGLGVSAAWALLSSGLNNLDDVPGAVEAGRSARRLAADSRSAVDATVAAYVLSDALTRHGDAAEAIAVIDGVAAPDRSLAHGLAVNRADALSRLGRHADALEAAAAADRLPEDILDVLPRYPALLAAVRARAGAIDLALRDSRRAVEVLERLRSGTVPADALRAGFDESFQWVHAQHVRLLSDHGDAGEALAATERARARAFSDLLAGREFDAVADAPAVNVAAIAAEARRSQSVVVAYWTDDAHVRIWVVTGDGLRAHRRVPMPSGRLTDLVARTWRAEEPLAGSGRPSAYRELHALLVQPVAAAITAARVTRLTIVPHGPLFRLSFAGLQRADGRFLVEGFAVHYVPSIATAVGLSSSREAPPDARRGLVVADPALGDARRAEGLRPLPGAAAEGRAVARVLGVEAADVLAGAAATESGVRAAVAGQRVVHFATHAVASDREPLESYLALAPSGDAADDGRLTAAEVYGLSLAAELVVLSGCRTASGAITGDGVVGLSRAFFVAGTPSIVASLWDLPDLAGRELLPAFYRAWQGGGSKADALRRAQRAMLAGLRAGRHSVETPAGRVPVEAHPAVWAGLVLLGRP